jgi:predicted GTPase
MTNYQQHKQKVLDLFQKVQALAESQKCQDTKTNLESAQKRLSEEKLYVVVCGEFKQGKSSLLNALLNETALFPVDVDITTNIVSSITYSEPEKITVILGEAGKEKAKQISRAEISNYVTEQRNQGNLQKARMLVIEAPNPQLKEGLVLVDTPGVGGLNIEHTALTYAFIPNADAILFVSDALAPLSEKELKFITERIIPHCKNLIFVVTKIDAVEDYEKILESNRNKLAKVLKYSATDISIIPVSSTNKLAYLKSQNLEDLEDSNFKALEDKLWQIISEQRGQILLINALNQIAKGISQIQTPLEAELAACQRENEGQLDELNNQFQEAQQKLQNLLDKNAEWQKELGYGLEDIQDNILKEFQEGFRTINGITDQYLNDDRLLENYQEIANLLESDLDALMANLGQQISIMAANLHSDIEIKTELNINPFVAGNLNYQKAQLERDAVQIQKAGLWDKAQAVGRGVVYGATPGTAVGAILGGTLGGVIGFLAGGIGAAPGATVGANIGAAIGGIFGQVSSTKQQLSQIEEKDRGAIKREVSRIIKNFIEQSKLSCQQSLMDTLKQLRRSMKDELTQQIKQEKKKSESVLNSLKKAASLSKEKAEIRAKDIQQVLQSVKQLQNQVEKLIKIILDSTSDKPHKPVSVTIETDKGEWADE